MATDTTNDLREFHQFVGRMIEYGHTDASPEEMVERWRDLQSGAGLAAIKQGLAEMEAGLGQPLKEWAAEFRKRHNIPDDVRNEA